MTLDELQTENLNLEGNPNADIVVVCDSPSAKVWENGQAMNSRAMEVFFEQAKANGFTQNDFLFVGCSPPIPEQSAVSEGRINKFLEIYQGELRGVLQRLQSAKLIVYLGKAAGRQVHGRSIKINSMRGCFQRLDGLRPRVLPMLSPANVMRRPEVAPMFNADFSQMADFKAAGWAIDKYEAARKADSKYQWVTDLTDILANPPLAMAVDTETRGLGGKPLIVTMSWAEGHGIAIPVDCDYYPGITKEQEGVLIGQVKELLENPDIFITGHNLGFDVSALRRIGIELANWYCDTMQLAFCADDNMLSKTLSDCVKRWVPEMAGYSDSFDGAVDKAHMELVPHDDMLAYACGDADATFRLTKVLVKLVKEDSRQWRCFEKVQMPTLKLFVDMKEQGILIDTDALAGLEQSMGEMEREQYKSLMRRVSGEVKRRHLEAGLSFTRDDFVRDILFSPVSQGGLGLRPIVFTKTTKTLDAKDRVPSVSSKDHLPYFADRPFVRDLIQYQKLAKMRSTYVGKASVEKISRAKITKSGELPTPLIRRLNEAGVSLDISGGTVRALIDGRPARSRRRLLELDGKPVTAKYTLPYREDSRVIVTDIGQILISETIPPTGFWQHLQEDGRIHPTFHLHRVVTGRSSSSDPNAQNLPKRGVLAKQYRKIFIPSPGFVLIEADLSQAELRIAAWMANEATMLRIYREGGDIHAATAAAILGITLKQFMQAKGNKTAVPERFKTGGFDGSTWGEYYDFMRYRAKAVNFGFLYGMGADKFRTYAKTDYGLDLTEEEAVQMRRAFFALYPRLVVWHKSMRAFVRQHGYVRALHGALRRLPSINSDDEGVQSECERQAINSPVQRFASDLGLIGMSRFFADAPRDIVRPLAFIHDAAVAEAREDRALECAAGMKHFLQTPPLVEWFNIESPIPILADISMGPSLGDGEEVQVEAQIPSWAHVA